MPPSVSHRATLPPTRSDMMNGGCAGGKGMGRNQSTRLLVPSIPIAALSTMACLFVCRGWGLGQGDWLLLQVKDTEIWWRVTQAIQPPQESRFPR